jgi:nicotinamidase/pyrazinamidase
VRASTLDAVAEGFEVTLVRDAVRAVDVQPGDGDRAIEEMREAGARVADSAELVPR